MRRLAWVMGGVLMPPVQAEDVEALRGRIAALEAELSAARAELAALQPAVWAGELTDPRAVPPPPVAVAPEEQPHGRWTVGGAIRANWTLGDYSTGARGPSRGGHGGDFSLDTFRLNLGYRREAFFAAAEYRWYAGVNFFHTLEAGWEWSENSQIKAGLTRVPFGVGPFGPANSWFFDQHYYVGLADDMDVGAVYATTWGDWSVEVAGFGRAEPSFRGSSDVGARYSFDVVDARGRANYFGDQAPTGYEERGQVNLRVTRRWETEAMTTDLGVSAQYGRLRGWAGTPSTDSHAVALHSLSRRGPWTLMLQGTRYDYGADTPHISGGFYDYTTDIATRGSLVAAALSYTWQAPVAWLDSITFYHDYSRLIKSAPGFRDSTLNVLGAAFARGGWYVYADWAYSDGNEFVGDFRAGMWADNVGRTWQSRYNINFGYYF